MQLDEGERVTGFLPVREFVEDEYLMMCTRRGTVKKTDLKAFKRPLGRGIIALGLDEGDELIAVSRVKAGDHVLISTKQGMAIRFDESDARAMGRTAHGVRGIGLVEGDEVVSMIVANGQDDPASLLTVCEHGYGKRTALTEYRSQNRGGKGLIDIKTTDRNGPVVAIAKVTEDDEVMLTTVGGNIIRTRVGDISLIGRNTQGVRLIRLDDDDSVGSLAKLPEEEITAVSELEAVIAGDETTVVDGDLALDATAESSLSVEIEPTDALDEGNDVEVEGEGDTRAR